MNVVKAVDARVDMSDPTMVVFESVPSVQFLTITTPTASDNVVWTIPVTPGLGLGRTINVHLVMNFVITGAGLGAFQRGNFLSLRAFPVNQSLSALNCQLGTNGVQITPNQYTSAFLQYNNETYAQRQNQSGTASAPDVMSSYADMVGFVGSPFGNGWEEDQSNAVNTVRTKQISNIQVSADETQLFFSVEVVEALIASPFTYDGIADPKRAIFNLNNVIVSANFQNITSRFLSFATPVGARVDNVSYLNWQTPAQAGIAIPDPARPYPQVKQELYVEFVAPFEDSISNRTRPTNYNYTFIQSTDTTIGFAGGYGSTATVSTNTLQLSVIPNAFLIYAIPSNAVLQNPTVSTPDFFFPIDSINIQFGERSGLLGQCSPYQLWTLSKKNGSNVDFPRWTGKPVESSGGQFGYYGGGVMIINVAQDLGLPKSTCSGMVYPSNFIANITIRNNTDIAYTNCTVRVVALTDGWITTAGSGNVDIHVGAITKDMLHEANQMPYLEEEFVRSKSRKAGYSGGKYSWGNFKHDMRGVLDYISPVSKPIISALTNKAVGKITGAGKLRRGTIRGMLQGHY